MHTKFYIAFVFMMIANRSHGQDTTGGTRPNIVIPLGKSSSEKTIQAGTQLPPDTVRMSVVSPSSTKKSNGTTSGVRAKRKSKRQPAKGSIPAGLSNKY